MTSSTIMVAESHSRQDEEAGLAPSLDPAPSDTELPQPEASQPEAVQDIRQDDIERMLETGGANEALRVLAGRLARDPGDHELWLLQTRVMQALGRLPDAQAACERALQIWPDIGRVLRLRLELARQADDSARAADSLKRLTAASPADAVLNAQIGAELVRQGDFEGALRFLRIAAPAKPHAHDALWNYTTALSVTGRREELMALQPLLDTLAEQEPHAPFYPYAHLGNAKLAAEHDHAALVRQAEALTASAAWLGTEAVRDRLRDAVEARRPFSLVSLTHALSRFLCCGSLRTHLALRPQEISAVGNSVWGDWFGSRLEDAAPGFLAELSRAAVAGVRNASVVGLPDAALLRTDLYNFGFLAEAQRLVDPRRDGSFASLNIVDALHELMPFFGEVLRSQPFIGVAGPVPQLALRLSRFCGIPEARSIHVPGPASHPAFQGKQIWQDLADEHQRILSELQVPFEGAVFLVSAPGPLAPIYCETVRARGGIALDLGHLMLRWAGA